MLRFFNIFFTNEASFCILLLASSFEISLYFFKEYLILFLGASLDFFRALYFFEMEFLLFILGFFFLDVEIVSDDFLVSEDVVTSFLNNL